MLNKSKVKAMKEQEGNEFGARPFIFDTILWENSFLIQLITLCRMKRPMFSDKGSDAQGSISEVCTYL